MAESFSTLERWNGGFPGELESATLEDLQPHPDNPALAVVLDAAQRLRGGWHGNHFAGLYLYGESGTGKTHAALGIARQLHDAGAEVFYRFAPGLGDKISIRDWTTTRTCRGDLQAASIFPHSYMDDITRNPKTVLVFDEYKPDKQRHLHAAVEAAAQFGGLVIVTSNYEDPFQLTDVQNAGPSTVTEALNEAYLTREAPDAAKDLSARREAAAQAISKSLSSRIAAGFKMIPFAGPDRRQERSFWGD